MPAINYARVRLGRALHAETSTRSVLPALDSPLHSIGRAIRLVPPEDHQRHDTTTTQLKNGKEQRCTSRTRQSLVDERRARKRQEQRVKWVGCVFLEVERCARSRGGSPTPFRGATVVLPHFTLPLSRDQRPKQLVRRSPRNR